MNYSLGKRLRVGLKSVLCLGVFCALCGYSFPQQWKTVADGVEHAQVRREFGGKPVNINLLRLDLRKVRLDVHHAMDMAIGTEKTSSIATRHGAIAAINAGFFRLDTSIWAGEAAGALKIDGEPLSESSNDRVAMFISNRGQATTVSFDHLNFFYWVRFGSNFDSDKGMFKLVGINRERKDNELVLFTKSFNRTTMTGPDGAEIVVRRNRIAAIIDLSGNSGVPNDGYILSIGGKARAEILPFAKVGTRVWMMGPGSVHGKGYDLSKESEDITNGVPQLIRNSKIDITWEQEKASKSFVETRHPRTAVAKLKDGKFLMLTADGRSDESAGLDLYDLAAYMFELGAVDAMNLDGGGSTTMFLDGKVVNKPSDATGERKIGDAILVTLRKKTKK